MSENDTAAVESLQALVAELASRVETLEGQLRRFHNPDAPDEEVVLAISAACAAYLGKRATIKQIRLRRGGSWVAQGRSGLQRSHAISHD